MKLVLGTNRRLCLLCTQSVKEAGVYTGKRMLGFDVLSMVHSIVFILCVDECWSIMELRLLLPCNGFFG